MVEVVDGGAGEVMEISSTVEPTLLDKLKEAGAHTIIYGLGSVLQSALGFLLVPLYTRQYTPELFGVFSLVMVVGTLAGSVFFLGASSALARSFYDYESKEERRVVVSTSLYITLIGALMQLLLAYFLARPISVALFHTPLYKEELTLALASSAIAFVNNLFYMLLRFERKSLHVIALNLASMVLMATLIVYLLVDRHLGVMAPILGTTLSQVFTLAFLVYLARDYLVMDCSRHEVGVQLRFGLPTVLVGLNYYVLDGIDRIFINDFGSLHDVGVYSLGYKIGMVIHLLLVSPFAQIWAPMRMEYREHSNARELFRLVFTYYWIIGLFVWAGMSVFAPELIHLVAGKPEYFAAFRVVPLVMLGHLIYGSINMLDNGIIFERKVVLHVYIFTAGVAINVGLNYWLIPRFGYLAAAATTLISYSFVALLVGIVSHRLYEVSLEGRRIALLAGSGVAALLLAEVVSSPRLWVMVAEKAGILLLLAATWYAFVLTGRERARLVVLAGGLMSRRRTIHLTANMEGR